MIEAADSGGDTYDVLLIVRVQYRGFAAQIDCWVQRAAWLGFTQDLVALEERRQGEARLWCEGDRAAKLTRGQLHERAPNRDGNQ